MIGVKRFAIIVAALALAPSLLAFDPTLHGNRIGILDVSGRYDPNDAAMAIAIQRYVRDELRSHGYDAFDVRVPFEGITRNDPANADYYVEVAGATGGSTTNGQIAVGTPHVAANIGLVVSHVAAQIRIYDGRTLELVRTYDLQKHKAAVVPTSIGFGGVAADVGLWATVPIFRWLSFRSAAHEVARDASAAIVSELAR